MLRCILGSSRSCKDVNMQCTNKPIIPKHLMEAFLPRNKCKCHAHKHRRRDSTAKRISQSVANLSKWDERGSQSDLNASLF